MTEAFLPLPEVAYPTSLTKRPLISPECWWGPPEHWVSLKVLLPSHPSPQPCQALAPGPFQLPIPVHSEDFTTPVASDCVHHHPRPQSSPHPRPVVPGRPPTAGKPPGQASASPEPRSPCSPLPLSHTGVPAPWPDSQKGRKGPPSLAHGQPATSHPTVGSTHEPWVKIHPGEG